ncbi:hypothetical protein MP228_011070 [Amoeboaphelidium protococcarum]|nr:hypothetical protein MP228_011070 [Amoeboaphelidium protococcarum]
MQNSQQKKQENSTISDPISDLNLEQQLPVDDLNAFSLWLKDSVPFDQSPIVMINTKQMATNLVELKFADAKQHYSQCVICSSFSSNSIYDLKQECQMRGLIYSGLKKQELLALICAYENDRVNHRPLYRWESQQWLRHECESRNINSWNSTKAEMVQLLIINDYQQALIAAADSIKIDDEEGVQIEKHWMQLGQIEDQVHRDHMSKRFPVESLQNKKNLLLEEFYDADLQLVNGYNAAFPPKINHDHAKQLYVDAIDAFSPSVYQLKGTCCCCAVSIPHALQLDVHLVGPLPPNDPVVCILVQMLVPRVAVEKRLDYLSDRLSLFSYHNKCPYNGVVLERAGILHSANKDCQCRVILCSNCLDVLSDNMMPKFALANGFFTVSRQQLNLPELTFIEQLMLALYRPVIFMIKLSQFAGSQSGYRGHFFAVKQSPLEVENVVQSLPCLSGYLSASVQIIFISKLKVSNQKAILKPFKRLFSVDTNKVLIWLKFLKQFSRVYADCQIAEDALSTYENDQFIDQIIKYKRVQFIKDLSDEDLAEESGLSEPHLIKDPSELSLEHLMSSLTSDQDPEVIPLSTIYREAINGLRQHVNDISSNQSDVDQRQPYSASQQSKFDATIQAKSSHTIAMVSGAGYASDQDRDFLYKCMPYEFPLSLGSPFNESRIEYVSYQQSAKHLLMIQSTTYRQSKIFQYYCYYKFRQIRLFRGIKYRVGTMSTTELLDISKITDEQVAEAMELEQLNKPLPDNHPLKGLKRIVQLIGSHLEYDETTGLRCKSEIFSTNILLGISRLFVTVSPADSYNPMAFAFSTEDFSPDVFYSDHLTDKAFRAKLANETPVSLAIFFNQIVSILLRCLFKTDITGESHGILGQCLAHYGMVQCQNRGTLHIHLQLWIAGWPSPDDLVMQLQRDVRMQQEIISYIDSIITRDRPPKTWSDAECQVRDVSYQLPLDPRQANYDELEPQWIHAAADEYQLHHCTFTCHKYNDEECRFDKPDLEIAVSSFDPQTAMINMSCSDVWLNNFNKFILLFINSNTDIQICQNLKESLAITYYVTNYITKVDDGIANQFSIIQSAKQSLIDKPPTTGIEDFDDLHNSARNLLIRIWQKIFKVTQIPANIVATLLLNLPMQYKSLKYEALSIHNEVKSIVDWIMANFTIAQKILDSITRALTILLPHSDSVGQDESEISNPDWECLADSTEVADATENTEEGETQSTIPKNVFNSIQYTLQGHRFYADSCNYDARPPELELMCEYEFKRHCKKVPIQYADFPFQPWHPQKDEYGIKMRDEPIVPNIIYTIPSIVSHVARKRIEHLVIIYLLFVPWRWSRITEISSFDYKQWLDNANDHPLEVILAQRIHQQSTMKQEAARYGEQKRKERELRQEQLKRQRQDLVTSDDSHRGNDELALNTISEEDYDEDDLNFQDLNIDSMAGVLYRNRAIDDLDEYAWLQLFKAGDLDKHCIDGIACKRVKETLRNLYSILPGFKDIEQDANFWKGSNAESANLSLKPFSFFKFDEWKQTIGQLEQQITDARDQCFRESDNRVDSRRVLATAFEFDFDDDEGFVTTLDKIMASKEFIFSQDSMDVLRQIYLWDDALLDLGRIDDSKTNLLNHPFNCPLKSLLRGWSLNAEQMLSVRLVGYHMLIQLIQKSMSPSDAQKLRSQQHTLRKLAPSFDGQLLAFVTGQGGVGKSFIIDALKELARQMGLSDQFCYCAPTGVAAFHIRGQTLHSIIGKSRDKKMPALTIEYIKKMKAKLGGYKYYIIDEVSMLDCNLLWHWNQVLQQVHENNLDFGGCHVIAFGDFQQLQAVAAHKVYPVQVGGPKSRSPQELWNRMSMSTIILQQQIRAAKCPTYRFIMDYVRDHNVPTKVVRLLKERLLQKLLTTVDFSSPDWMSAPMIVSRNAYAYHLNVARVQAQALQSSLCEIVIAAVHTVNDRPISDPRLITKIELNFGKDEKKLPSVLHICSGCKVILQTNISVSLGLVNGAVGVVHTILFPSNTTTHHIDSAPNSVFVTSPPVVLIRPEIQVPELQHYQFPGFEDYPPGLVPIVPIQIQRKVRLHLSSGSTSITVKRTQLPLQPAYAFTDYKTQSKTFKCAFVELNPPQGKSDPNSATVKLGRIQSLDGLCILNDFDARTLNRPIDEELRKELQRQRANDICKKVIRKSKNSQTKISDNLVEKAASSSEKVCKVQTLVYNSPKRKRHIEDSSPAAYPSVISPIKSSSQYTITEQESEVIEEFFSQQAMDNDDAIFPILNTSTTLHRYDFLTLGQDEWVNDQIISAYLELISHECQQSGLNVQVLSSHYYELNVLRQSDVEWVQCLSRLTQFDITLMPVHVHNNHWVLVSVDWRRRIISYYDSLNYDDGFLVLLNVLQQCIALNRDSTFFDDICQLELRIVKDCPQQTNGYDCGVFVCQYAKFIAFGIPFNFGQHDIDDIRTLMLLELISHRIIPLSQPLDNEDDTKQYSKKLRRKQQI